MFYFLNSTLEKKIPKIIQFDRVWQIIQIQVFARCNMQWELVNIVNDRVVIYQSEALFF